MTSAAVDQEQLLLRAAIGRALGQPLPAHEGFEVLGGAVAVETGRVGWIEQQTDPPQDGYVPVRIELRVAQGGQPLGAMEVPTYNPFFGCDVRHMRWYGEALILIYREKHRMILARMEPPYTGLTMARIHDRFIVDGDAVYFVSDHAELLEGLLLPSLAPALPLPPAGPLGGRSLWQPSAGRLALVETARVHMKESRADYLARREALRSAATWFPLPPPEARALVEAPERLWARLHELLAPTQPPPFGVEVLLGSVATPFWRPEQRLGTRYADMGRSWDRPEYLAVYWHQHLVAEGRAVEAREWRHWLQRLSLLAPVDPLPWTGSARGEELVARAALVYLRARARVLEKTCRTGRLPEEESCSFFSRSTRPHEPWERDESYPAGFREVLRQVSARGPKSLSAR